MRWIVPVVACLIAVTVSAGFVAAESGTAGEEIGLDELRDGGDPLPAAPPGVRSDGERLFWLEHYPADAITADVGAYDSPQSEYVTTSTTVDRQSVWLQTVVLEGELTTTAEVIYWRPTTEQREVNGTTVEEETADVIARDEHELELQEGIPIQEIPLQQIDGASEVTIRLSSGPQWRFTYEPSALAQPVSISSVGDFWGLAAIWILIPAIGGVLGGGYLGRRAIGKAGMGPGYPLVAWLLMLGLGFGLLALVHFSSIAELIGQLPWVVGGAVGVLALLVYLETQAVRKRTVEFLKPKTEYISGPAGESSTSIEILEVERQAETVVDLPDGDPAVVRPGLRPFLARVFGSSATIPSIAFDTRISVGGDDVDEMILVDPAAEDPLTYSPEGFVIEPPATQDELKRVAMLAVPIGLAAVAVGLWISWLWAAVIGALGSAAVLLEPVDGTADCKPARAHERSAWVSAMLIEEKVSDAATLEDARERIVELQGRSEKETQEAIEQQDATLVEELLGTDLDRSVDPDERSVEIFDDPDPDEEEESHGG